jgi:pimeloyl-ACP methyl ester carboxylesterase
MASRGLPWIGPRGAATMAAAGGLAAAAAILQRRHLRALADDPVLAQLSAPLRGRRRRVVSRDGTVLHAEVFGHDGKPTVVLAHGWTEQLSFWGPVIRSLVDRDLRVAAYDLRGHGLSEPAFEGDYSLQRFGQDVEAVLAHCAPGEPATVAGHSLGAMSIAAWAQHHDPQRRARAAALINTGLGNLVAENLLFGELAKLLNHPWASRAFLGARTPVPPFSTPLQQAVIRYAAFGPDAGPGEIAFFERMLIECRADVRAAVGIVLSDMDLWEAVEKLTLPTLVIAGERDRLTPPAHARRMVEELPVAVGLLELPRTGHMGPLERPIEISDALEQLVRDPCPAHIQVQVGISASTAK